MRALASLIADAAVIAAPAAPRAEVAPARPAYVMIVNPRNPVTDLDRRFVEDAYLKKIKLWPNGQVIRPVDLPADSLARQRFSDDILRRPLAALRAYWQQRIFSGRDVPPPAVDTDAAVISYVNRFEGALGYVSGGAALTGVKAVSLR